MGKAKSLARRRADPAPLLGADGQIYAMAQGNLAVGGLGAEGKDGSQIVVNIPRPAASPRAPRSSARSRPASRPRRC